MMISDEQFKNKLVAVLNKSIDTGKIMNALAHMCIGLGSAIDKEDLRLSNYKDADGGSHPFISEIPFIVLTENSNKIRKLRAEAISNHIIFNDFTDTMTIGTYKEQIEKTSLVKNENLVYYGIVLFGDWDKVTELTRKFSLWR
ncbi:MAG TPA: DUF2000 domain-containing protein [Gammaproteobacteria bacterium]|nr:DUF2000 domain-containing protein [Gammaproteobacteria bacterium]